MTASHCVGAPGSDTEVTFYRGVAKIRLDAVVVWDSVWSEDDAGLDLAFIATERPWPAILPLARYLPRPGERVDLLSFALGIRRWAGWGTLEGLFDHDELGWVLVYRNNYGAGGASGSPVLYKDQAIGMHTHGYTPLLMSIAMPAGRIARALRSLDRNGPMKPPVPEEEE